VFHSKGRLLVWRGIAIVLLALLPAASLADASPTSLLQALPPLPSPGVFPVQLVLDDDGAEGIFGFVGATARQFLWFNQFTNPGPFTLQEIWVLFPDGQDVPPGGDVQLVVYLDADGDPSNGANLLATYDETIQAADGNTFSVYLLSPPLAISGAGDVLVGVINRFFETGVTPPPTCPAALDTTVSQDRSWFALWTGDPPDPPHLATANVVDVLDGAISGNFMIRGFGRAQPTLTVDKVGSGGGMVTSDPAGISCGGDCTENYIEDTNVTLTATPDANVGFAGWSGACSGADPVTIVTMDANKTCTATFETHTLTVNTTGGGTGRVTSAPAGINCSEDCTENYAPDTVVALAAHPGVKSYLASWSGDCVSTGALTAQVTMDADKTCTATFGYPVGGIVVPVDRLGLLVPWVGMVALAGLAALGVALVRRRNP
jgi:hypothetical protein